MSKSAKDFASFKVNQMTESRIHKFLARFYDIKPSETSSSLLLFTYFFLITTSAYIIKPVKISLYLHWLTAEKLPYAYLLTAILIGFVVALNSKLLNIMKRQLYISLSLFFFIACLFIFWWLLKQQWSSTPLLFWLWVDIFTATSVTQFWIFINDIYNPHQAKRLVSFLVSGGLLGGIAGALITSLLAKAFGTENLLLICPLFLIFALLIVNFSHKFIRKEQKSVKLPSSKEPEKTKKRYREGFDLLIKNRHLLLLSGIVIMAIVVTTLIDFQFNSIVERVKSDQDTRTAFLGTFFTTILIFSYLLHIFTTNRILKNFGIRIALLIAPFFLVIGSLAVFFVPWVYLIYWATLIKGGERSLAHSLNQSIRELLYIPIPPDMKYKAKVFVDMFVNKLARGFGAVLILVFFSVFHFSIRQLSFVIIIFSLIWIILNLMITKEYIKIVKRNLTIKWQDADKLGMDKVDIDMSKLVFDTLQNKKRSSVLYAMNLFDLIKKEKMSPELKKIISHKSDEIRACSMDSLLELDGEALLPQLEDSLEDDSFTDQVNEIMSLDVYQELMKSKLEKIKIQKGKQGEVSRMEAAKVLGMMDPASPLVHNLNILLRDESPEVVKYAIESAGKLRKREHVPLIIRQLNNPAIGRVAIKSLVEYGIRILGTLKDYLSDEEIEIQIRKHIPDILSRIGTQKAADLLAKELKKKDHDVESEIIDSLYNLRSKNPQIVFSEEVITPEIVFFIKKGYQILMEWHDMMADGKKAQLAKDLEKNLTHSVKQIFELLGLIYPLDDIIKAYKNIRTGTKKSIDYSIELLDNVLKREIKEIFFPLIDDISFEEKVYRCGKMYKSLEKNKK